MVAFGAERTRRGHREIDANDPNRSSPAFDPDLSSECAFAGASLAVGSALWRRVGFVAKARGRVHLLQIEQEGAMIPALMALVVERLEYVTHRLDDRELRQTNLSGRSKYRIEVLNEVADWCARAKVAIDHAPTVLLEHTAIGMAASQRHRDLGGGRRRRRTRIGGLAPR